MNYTIRYGETLTDAILNSTGDISNWDLVSSYGFYSSWTPSLVAGETVIIPDTVNLNNQNLAVLNPYPANNNSVSDLDDQISNFFALLSTSTPIPSENVLPEVDTNNYYTVRPLETIGDSLFNGSGNFQNWDIVTAGNFFDTWTPDLIAGQKVKIPSSVTMDLNNYRAMNAYPANNHSVADIYQQIENFFTSLTLDRWILRYGYWLDSDTIVGNSIWEDTAFWKDN